MHYKFSIYIIIFFFFTLLRNMCKCDMAVLPVFENIEMCQRVFRIVQNILKKILEGAIDDFHASASHYGVNVDCAVLWP